MIAWRFRLGREFGEKRCSKNCPKIVITRSTKATKKDPPSKTISPNTFSNFPTSSQLHYKERRDFKEKFDQLYQLLSLIGNL
jgi:hypothetical protein